MPANQTRASLSRTARVIAAGFALLMIGAVPAFATKLRFDLDARRNAAPARPTSIACAPAKFQAFAKITACLRRKKASLSDACRVAMGE